MININGMVSWKVILPKIIVGLYTNDSFRQTFLRLGDTLNRGERMKKILALLLVLGVLIGTFSAVEELSESFCEQMNFSGDEIQEDGLGDPAPCGGGEGSGSGGVPG
jgi:hypothetical protein